MTTINEFVSQLERNLDRRNIRSELAYQQELIASFKAGIIEQASEIFDNQLPSSQRGRQFVMRLMGAVRFPRKEEWFSVIGRSLDVLSGQLTEIHGLIDQVFPPKLETAAISYRQANVLAYIGTSRDYIESVSGVLTELFHVEAYERGGQQYRPPRGEAEYTSKAEQKLLLTIPFIFLHQKDIKRFFLSLPDTVVDQDGEAILNTLGKNDLFSKHNLIGGTYNPFYLYGKWRAEHQADRYLRQKEQRRVQQLRLMELRGLLADDQEAGDLAQIQKQILLVEARINKLSAKIRDFDETYLEVPMEG